MCYNYFDSPKLFGVGKKSGGCGCRRPNWRYSFMLSHMHDILYYQIYVSDVARGTGNQLNTITLIFVEKNVKFITLGTDIA